MDEEPAEAPMPNVVSITSSTTRIKVEPRPPGVGGRRRPRVQLVLRLAMTECHTWLGIGGHTGRVRRPKRLRSKIRLALDDNLSSSSSSSSGSGGAGPDYLRSGADCRRLIRRAIKNSLSSEEEGYYRYIMTPARWDEAVPVGVERELAAAVHRSGGGGPACKAHVDIRVRLEFIYSEPQALLLACEYDDGGGECSICFEDMSYEGADLPPGCTHGFHSHCIAAWFHRASTCPVCRRDQLPYLPPDYRDLHRKMTIVDPDGLPD